MGWKLRDSRGAFEKSWMSKAGTGKGKTARDRWKDLGSKLMLNWTSVSRKVDRSALQALLKEHRCGIGKGTGIKKKK